jgi:hypothetical protein
MPVEIKELIIRAEIETLSRHPAETATATPVHATRLSAHPSADDLVQACVQEVLRILERRDGR